MESGTRLGPYEILEQLGAGGMGEVWLAEDTRLHRRVAIKVLPEEFAGDPERLARFEQEARASAALNHPHIAAVFDVGVEDGTHYMVQEYLEGETLREPLKKGALPLKKALDLATEIAEALAAAHAAGIIHRDLKPENIFITKEGHAKVLDFGLAKLIEMAPAMSPGTDASQSPTMLGTVAGQVMGTAGYMAPEQVQGDAEIDHRADLFAFGCVLYETVTGRRAFAGKNVHDTLNRIISDDPAPVVEINESLPAELHRIVRKALAKDVGRRYQAAGDLNIDLRQLQDDITAGVAIPMGPRGESVAHPTPGAAAGIPWRLAALAGIVLVAVSALVTSTIGRPDSRSPQQSLKHFDVDLIEGQAFPIGGGHDVLLSPDGNHLVYRAQADGVIQLYHRPLDQAQATAIAGTERARYPFFSPDSRTIGFTVGSNLTTVELTGGEPFTLCNGCAPVPAHGNWRDDTIIFNASGSLWQISAQGGTPTLLAEPESGGDATTYTRPVFLPDGNAVLLQLEQSDGWKIAILNLDTGEMTTIADEGSRPAYLETGHILYAAQETLFAVPFDSRRLEVTGEPIPVQRDLRIETFGAAQYSVSDDGTLAYIRTSGSRLDYALVWIDRSGATTILTSGEGEWLEPRLSPDGQNVAYRLRDPTTSIGDRAYIYNVGRGTRSPLPLEGSILSLAWSPSGDWLYFSSDSPEGEDIARTRTDFSGVTEPVVTKEYDQQALEVSRNGRLLLYTEEHPESGWDLWVAFLDEPGREEVFLNTPANENGGRFSPDGRWLAYVSDSEESGRYEVFVSPYPEPGSRIPISTSGGRAPRWSADGRELFYLEGNAMMVVNVLGTTAEFRASAPRALFSDMNASPQQLGYDVTDDAERFLASQRVGEQSDEINVILNWFEELKQRVPTGR